jgi:hypothetical protein
MRLSLFRYVQLRISEAFNVTRAVFWEQYGKAWLLLYFGLGGIAVYRTLDETASIRSEIKSWGTPLMTGAILIIVLFVAVYWFSAYRIWRGDQKKLSEQANELGDIKEHRLECFDVAAHVSEHKIRDTIAPIYTAARYIKVGIRSRGARVHRCRAYLTHVSEIFPEGSLEVSNFDAIELKWSLGGHLEVDIPDNFDRFFDVLCCDEPENKLKLCAGVVSPIRMRGFFDKNPATFKLVVKVISDDAPTLMQNVFVEWKGSTDNVAAKGAM